METHRRSLAKSLSWRVFAFALTATVVWLVTGKLQLAGEIGLADTVVKLGAFYLHERAWTRISFGKAPAAEFEI
jgi:uncharacterized membrane protein